MTHADPHDANSQTGGEPELNGQVPAPSPEPQTTWTPPPPAPDFDGRLFAQQEPPASSHGDPWERTEINRPVAGESRQQPALTPSAVDQPRPSFPPPMAIDSDPRRWDSADFRRPPPTGNRRHPTPAPTPHAAPHSYANNLDRFYPPVPHSHGEEAAWSTSVEVGQDGPDESAWSTAAAERTGPKQGWRGGLAKVGIKLAKSARELEYDRDVLRMKRKLAYPQNVVVISLKGGVGKSTSAVALGSTLAHHRDVSDVVTFDSATDGSVRRRMPVEQNRAVTSDTRHFLRSISTRQLSGSEIQVQLYSNPAGLQALVAAQDLDDYELNADEFGLILSALHKEYMVNLIDMSGDRRVPTFWPAIAAAHAVVLVTTPNSVSVDNVKRFIDLLRARHPYLVTRTVLLWNNAAPGKEVVINVDATKNYLVRQLSPQNDPTTCLVDIPMDPHLAAGGEINLALLHKTTRRQFERAAALLMDKLPDRTAQH
ncbi:AAA family ATPase [Mycolicibacterium goodii]|uniref:MinD/ParA family ATP-binding protein n=1 Tax=Mycolicibacterium goodii TaxID=134601 RepID=UPI001BDC79A5|nr:AAA family ATPase [Mycolicibacterium goodii]MBU8820968.1 AAA family ATPase [Mycolicibacterium goodii]